MTCRRTGLDTYIVLPHIATTVRQYAASVWFVSKGT
jgi:hypothetical protein